MLRFCFILYYVLVTLCFSSIAFSQQKLEGKILDSTNTPVQFASIVLYEDLGQNILESTISDTLGNYQIDISNDFSAGVLKVQHLSFEKHTISISSDILAKEKLDIILTESLNLLDEITLTKEKILIRQATDRLIFEPSGSELAKNKTTYELFNFVPLVTVTERKPRILGKDVTQYYINGRKTRMSEDAVINMLMSLPAKEIKSIEVITAPNSTLGGDGNFGILNIELKRDVSNGLRGDLMVALYEKADYLNDSENVNLHFNNNKLSIHSTVSRNGEGSKVDKTWNSQFRLTENYTNAFSNENTSKDSYFGCLFGDYQLSKKQTLGTGIYFDIMNGGSTFSSTENYFSNNLSEQADSSYYTQANRIDDALKLTANINYTLKLDTLGSQFDADIDYLTFKGDRGAENHFYQILDNQVNPYNTDYRFSQNVIQSSDVWSGKIDFKKVFDSKTKINIGCEGYYSKIKDDNQYAIIDDNNNSINDPTRSNLFTFDEVVLAAFISFEHKFNGNFSMSGGLRVENTQNKGVLHTTKEKMEKQYWDFLPSFAINYIPFKKHSFSFSVKRYIGRPKYRNLNPFRFYSSPTYYTTGNPRLDPTTTYDFNLRYIFNNKFILDFVHQYADDAYEWFELVKDENTIVRTFETYGYRKTYYIQPSYNESLFNGFWRLRTTCSLGKKFYKGNIQDTEIDRQLIEFSGSLGNEIYLNSNKDLSVDASIWHTAGATGVNTAYPDRLGWSFQLKKAFKNTRLTIFYNDISYLQDGKSNKTVYETELLQTITVSNIKNHSIGVYFVYDFGNKNVSKKNMRRTSNKNVSNRIKN